MKSWGNVYGGDVVSNLPIMQVMINQEKNGKSIDVQECEQRFKKYGNLLPSQWRQLWVLVVGDNRLKVGLCIAINDTCLFSFLHYGLLSCGRG